MYEGPLVRYAAGIVGDIERARDVVQDTFLRLCGQKDLRIADHLAPWLFTVCRNRAFDLRKKERHMQSMDEGETSFRLQQRRRFGEPERLEHEEALGQALTILRALPERQREVIRLKFQHELSYKEISRITGLTVTNVGFLIHTGLRAIREKMNLESSTGQGCVRRIK
jgi:RNA polymerase sigma-70 factor (ECF subfamily)